MISKLTRLLEIVAPSEAALEPERRALAARLDDCVRSLRQPAAAHLAGVRPEVLVACEPAAVSLSFLLRDRHVDVRPIARARLHRFLEDRARSPLFGADPGLAAAELRAVLAAVSARATGTERRPLRLGPLSARTAAPR